jgi:hypothetical protein
MRKFILTMMLSIGMIFSSNAQTSIYVDTVDINKLEHYSGIDVWFVNKPFSSKVYCMVDYQQHFGLFSDQRLKDENGDVIVFEDKIEGMKYFYSKGWKIYSKYQSVHGKIPVTKFSLSRR